MAVKVDPYVKRNLPWNFSVNLIDITFITLAFSLISRETIMPLLISELTESRLAIGLVPAIFSIAFYLPQLFAANHAERLRRKLPFVMLIGGLMERVPYVFAGAAIYFLAESAPGIALLAIYLVIGLGAFGRGGGDAGLVHHDRQGAAGESARHLLRRQRRPRHLDGLRRRLLRGHRAG